MRIGILGGGQLARMIIEENNKYGFEFHVLSREENSPAGQITKNEMTGNWNEEEMLRKFSSSCDIITLENEFIDYQKIKFLEDLGKKIYPGSGIIKLVQDKFFQKKTLERINIPISDFCAVETKEDIINFSKKNNYPLVLKSRTMGYDGKGNYQMNSKEDINEAFESLSHRGKLMVESFVDFDIEIATQVVRNESGEVKVYHVVETIQKNHICNLVIASKSNFQNIKKKVEEIAIKIVTELNYTGVMGIEMFLKGEDILVNELAPRVHNSGHYTMEGCYTSQFENHIRAIMNFPLGNVDLKDESSVMINIIGERNGEARLRRAGEVLSKEKVYLHIYGKKETREGRKMGHINVLREDVSQAIDVAKKCREAIDI